ncbi:SDR family oxidoreductase [Sphingobium sp. Sx8-8]|uniref:SDR family oxidoreductase n=1 Tax=Sphingobium sp. Sx8-8 TaxID=2933617 RepID=UPI001F583385|nr:SDR family oxidoreductase [Sphingobium sp. Sx8-8]
MQQGIALITGACGGMGQACAQVLGRHYRLALSDIAMDRVDALADSLERLGHAVVARHAGDYAQPGVAAAAVEAARAAGPVRAVVHTAGLSPVQAGWDRILRTNIVATAELLDALEADEREPFNAVLISSIAGHGGLANPRPELDALLDAPLQADVVERAGPLLAGLARADDPFGASSPAYAYSKAAVIRMAERRAARWGRAGRRIVTISPGVTRTPMGIAEVEGNAAARSVAEITPLGIGSPMGIANAAEFLLSDLAASITGTDLRIDGGLMPAARWG